MKIIVTGGSGRVGIVTVRALLDAGHEVVVADRAPMPAEFQDCGFAEVSITDYAAILKVAEGADAIVHLAGLANPVDYEPQDVHHINVTGSYNVLTAATALGIGRVVMASSVNAIGMTWSASPVFDYLPVDERHPTRNEDPYSLSKWLGEVQADSIVRLNPQLSVASLRLHMFMPHHEEAHGWSVGDFYGEAAVRGLWGYTTHRMWIDACLSALTAPFAGHERFFIVADRNVLREDSRALSQRHFPDVEIRPALSGDSGFFDCSNAKNLLGWSGADD
ncbi:NAD-dependent epimerase/dehydratase family protein [Demequina aurantiaca]|uniref:NAD-dependent epimerase/dehydratase family protein n=1 Tax=Demequina aurantiaca TaxID=676200 RepID=UPI0007866166|nr:NAD(P)-dependent oxidoreductase [Demequina aurantiaca]